jgi:Dolichyl-phosphate-mannose-protein mannosyltransferase
MTSPVEPTALVEPPPIVEDDPVIEETPEPGWWRRHGPALAGYVLLTGVCFWPVVGHLRTRILSDGGDGASYLWNLWQIPHALVHGHNPFDTREIFFPVGAHTAFNTNMPLVSVLSWPLQKVFGLGVAANIVQLTAVVLSGLAAYLLAEHVTGNRPAAFVAGAAFTFAPYRFVHASHYDLSHLELLPFGILALLLLHEAPTRRRALVFGAVVGATFLTDLYYFVFLLIAAAVVAAWRWRETLRREMAVRFAQAGAVAAVVGAPLMIAMVRELAVFHSLDPVRDWAGADNYSANFLSWITPSIDQRIWGTTFLHVNNLWTGGERMAFPGFTIMLLAAAGALWGGRKRSGGSPASPEARRGLWIALGTVFALLSFGPFLHLARHQGGRFVRYGIRYTWWMPYQLLHAIPVVNGVRVPGRFSVVGILALDVLAALALDRLMARRPDLRRVVPAVALLLVMVEFFPQGTVTQSPAIPKAYSAIAADPGRRAVLEIPLQWRTGFGDFGDVHSDHSIFLYYATRHGKPLAGGMVARYPKRSRQALLDNPIYAQVVPLQEGDPTFMATFDAFDLRRAGIGYVVYHRNEGRPAALAYLSGLHLPVLADDGTVLVWRVPS